MAVRKKPKRASIADIEPLVTKHRGNIAAIARELKVSRGTIYNRIAASPTLEAAIDDAKETFVDDVQSALFDNALGGNVAAQIFIMKAHPVAKQRGWGERHELSGKDGGPVVLDHTHKLAEVSDDDIKRTLAALGRSALAASGRTPVHDDSGGAEGEDTTGEEE